MKKGLVLFSVSVLLILSVSLVSAGWFGDFFAKITGGVANASCINECSAVDSKQCSGNGYQICGNWDTDTCSEWGSITSCGDSQTCSGGTCINSIQISLNSSNPTTTVIFNNYTYEVELISASDTSATIKVTQGGMSQTKEVNEGESKEIRGLNVAVKSA
ncbi:MAG: hypothetical protein AABY15_08845, partial [Nanoarchaeota archaeon]